MPFFLILLLAVNIVIQIKFLVLNLPKARQKNCDAPVSRPSTPKLTLEKILLKIKHFVISSIAWKAIGFTNYCMC